MFNLTARETADVLVEVEEDQTHAGTKGFLSALMGKIGGRPVTPVTGM